MQVSRNKAKTTIWSHPHHNHLDRPDHDRQKKTVCTNQQFCSLFYRLASCQFVIQVCSLQTKGRHFSWIFLLHWQSQLCIWSSDNLSLSWSPNKCEWKKPAPPFVENDPAGNSVKVRTSLMSMSSPHSSGTAILFVFNATCDVQHNKCGILLFFIAVCSSRH